jgi:hypothetical protein
MRKNYFAPRGPLAPRNSAAARRRLDFAASEHAVAAESRLRAGIHYRSDLVAGLAKAEFEAASQYRERCERPLAKAPLATARGTDPVDILRNDLVSRVLRPSPD